MQNEFQLRFLLSLPPLHPLKEQEGGVFPRGNDRKGMDAISEQGDYLRKQLVRRASYRNHWSYITNREASGIPL